MRPIIFAIALALSLSGGAALADHHETDAGDAPPPAVDDTGRNVRDRSGDTLTPFDQGGSEADREITAAIRRAVVANEQLSISAHNVKIITRDGQVTLRGPVKSDAEKTAIANAAAKVSGVRGVDNQLEVEQQQ